MSSAAAPAARLASLLTGGAKPRPLVLHLDVNRTLIQVDPAGGKTLEDVMNANIASRVLGDVDVDGKTWVPVADADPEASSLPQASPPSRLFYDDFVDNVLFPKPAEMATLPPDEARELWATVSAKRRETKHGFTTSPDAPGARFRASYDKLMASMARPDGKGTFYLIPSFFESLNLLSELDVPFAVVFRTFGTDLPPVLEEYFSFIRGEHPVFTPRGPRLAAAKEALVAQGAATWCPTGQLHRGAGGMSLTWGACDHKQPGPTADVAAHYAAFGLVPTPMSYVSLADAVAESIQRPGVGVPTLGLIDYYPWWAAHSEHFSAGKAFPVEVPSKSSDAADGASLPFHVFFDDNIRFGEPEGRSIVDFRPFTRAQVSEGERQPEASSDLKMQDSYMVRVDPWEALTRPAFFFDEAAARVAKQAEL